MSLTSYRAAPPRDSGFRATVYCGLCVWVAGWRRSAGFSGRRPTAWRRDLRLEDLRLEDLPLEDLAATDSPAS